ncbi:MAG: Hpt domain-containing protein [Pseudomonadales bacterium]|nr:Hpt domain-containing protein [Pseudomonadales bacterium]
MDSILDRHRGIANVNGNQELYERLLEEFCTDHGADATRIREALDANDLATAQRIGHTLKGVSGTLGAERTRSIAVRVDAALKRDEPPKESDLAELDESLQRLASMIGAQSKRGAPTGLPDASLDASAMARIKGMLEEMNPAAEDLAISLVPALSRINAEVTTRLIAQIKRFDFDAALASLTHLERTAD